MNPANLSSDDVAWAVRRATAIASADELGSKRVGVLVTSWSAR
ncbi:hypothetical protein AB0I28_32415 [Phytomonospora sp. NPDC050363]